MGAPESDVGPLVDASPALMHRRYDTDSDSVLTYEEFELFFVDYLCRTGFCNCCMSRSWLLASGHLDSPFSTGIVATPNRFSPL